ncbi:MAG: tryptophan synthase subunit beta [Desulfobacteraceae bacterium]|nr:MAG: tryptophan synthase subunit beta [Desulfobacteraceae bacterium]
MQRLGYYGEFGGAFVPEVLIATLEELRNAFTAARNDTGFWPEYLQAVAGYSSRPTPLTFAENLTRHFNGARVYIKREDLNHTGAHKINNVMGQGLLVKRMGKTRVIAETGAGQHGVATATMAARMGLRCTIYMGAIDVERQRPNVFWMEQLGAEVVPVRDGARVLKDAINAALRDWVTNMDDTHYVLGTACGPHPFPEMVAYFQSIIGQEAREQILKLEGKLPARVYACVGGGSNALGIFQAFLNDAVKLVGVEAGGKGLETGRHAARLSSREAHVGVAQGYKTFFLQNADGQMRETHSVAAGLDYIGVSPILADLREKGRVNFKAVTDTEVLEALKLVMKKEGLIPALESSHAFAQAFKDLPQTSDRDCLLINQSGRGDKDIFTVADALQDSKWKEFIKKKAEVYGE